MAFCVACLVAHFPMEDVIGLFLAILAQDGSIGVESLVRIHQHRQFFVFHLHQFRHVGRGVLFRGHAEGHFLRLKQNFAGGQHHLLVVKQRGHPGQAGRGQILAGNHGQRAGHLHRLVDIDALEARVGVRAADHVAEDHPRQVDVVHVVALCPG